MILGLKGLTLIIVHAVILSSGIAICLTVPINIIKRLWPAGGYITAEFHYQVYILMTMKGLSDISI